MAAYANRLRRLLLLINHISGERILRVFFLFWQLLVARSAGPRYQVSSRLSRSADSGG